MKHTDTGLTKIETPEEGATFEVYLTSAGSYAKADDAIRDRLIIDKDGFAKSKDLPYGTYTVHQAEGWDGSAFIQDFQVKIDTDGKTYSYIINNERFYAFLKVVKLDSVTGEPIPVEGIGFQIFTPAGELVSFWDVDTWYSNAEGVVKVPTDLEYGKGYTAVEQNAPEGYILATEPFTFDITPENAATEDDLLVVTLEAKNTPTQVQFLKVDPYGEPVNGAKLQVVDTNGKVVDEWISDDTPHTIYKLPVGATYTLREVEAPDGYLLAEPVTFTVQETTEVQTVTMENEKIPTIGTTATVDGLHVAQPKGEIDFIDTVYYSDFVPGRTYTVVGVIMGKATGEPITDPDGKQLTASRMFTPEESEGDVEVIFHVDAVLLEGKTTVCFEHLFKNGKQIAVHADLSDDEQTVYFPGIGTTATINSEHEVVSDGTLTLVDVVGYKGLEPGKEYTVKGVLMDKSTGEPFNDLTAEILFTPTEANGAVEVSFSFDSALLTEDTTLVAFETLYYGDMELAVHADLEDEGQTVTVRIPTMHTTATVGGEKTAVASSKIVIDDFVTFTNLVVGKEFTLKGVLMDKRTGEKFLVNGEEVTAEVTFMPETSDGEVTVTFVFDGSGITQETRLMVFESLYKDGVELLTHADIDDADQTVTIDTPDTPQTDDSITRRWFYIGGGALCLAAMCGLILNYRRRRKHD